ncbi:LppU family putative lipoprotein [Nocardia aurantia]|uniref:Uncharacterized protein n=1 Tax=Nocardia aurantia TaxID=2585199 RepID=A0A7K0DM38_9NOCA|nr:hypothetical protein [Nocardia aurantia]MQY26830.1 hypothetical protein [Nocardia aurantia]
MSRRRGQALIALLGFVVTASVATGVLVGGALWAAGDRNQDNESRSATGTSAPTTDLVAPPPSVPAGPVAEAPATVATAADAATSEAELHKGAEEKKPGADIAAGDCVGFGGENGTIQKSACGTPGADFRVAGVAAPNASCPADSDRTYPRPLPGGEQDTLCLDVPWVVGHCVDVNGAAPAPAPCVTALSSRVKVVDIKQGTADVNACAGAGDRGFVYTQRRFVVCVAHL